MFPNADFGIRSGRTMPVCELDLRVAGKYRWICREIVVWNHGVVKQVIVVNGSLVLPAGKLAAQVAHAAVASFLTADRPAQQAWLNHGMPKIVVAARSETELLPLEEQAVNAGVAAAVIRDAGRTVIAAGTVTCLGLGPAPAAEIDKLTGSLPLL